MKAGSSNTPNPEILEWLKGSRNYTRGLALLLKYANKPATLLRLTKHRNQQQLERALRDVLHPPAQPKPRLHERKVSIPIVVENAVAAAVKAGVVKAEDVKETTRKDNELLDKKRSEWRDKVKEIERLRGQIYFIGRNAATHTTEPLTQQQQKQRAAIAVQVLKLDGECGQLVAEMKYYDRTGVWPKKQRAARNKKAATGNEKENARKNAVKLRKKIADAKKSLAAAKTEKQVVKLNEQLNDWSSKLEASQKVIHGK